MQVRNELSVITESLLNVNTTLTLLNNSVMETNKSVSAIERKLTKHDEQLNKLQSKLNSTASKVENIQDAIGSLPKMKDDIQATSEAVGELSFHFGDLTTRIKQLERKSLEQESRSRRNNLIFHGIKPAVKPAGAKPAGGKEKPAKEDCEKLVRDFIVNEMNMETSVVGNMKIARAHRMGKETSSKSRPVIVYFEEFKDKERVKKSGKELKGKSYSVAEDFPREVRIAREKLVIDLKKYKKEGKKCTILYPAKLLVEGEVVREIPLFPENA